MLNTLVVGYSGELGCVRKVLIVKEEKGPLLVKTFQTLNLRSAR